MSNFKPFIYKFKEVIMKEGYDNISTFVNKWVDDGGTFKTLHQWLLLKDVDFEYHTVWNSLRKYLTTSFDTTSSFWNKWDSVAQTKGFDTIAKLMEVYRKKHTTTEMANELGVTTRTIEYLMIRLDGDRSLPLKQVVGGKRPSHKDEDGFTKTDVKEKWNKILSGKGFNSLREAANYYLENKLPPSKMAEDLGVTERALKIRLDKAGILLSKETIGIRNTEDTLGLL